MPPTTEKTRDMIPADEVERIIAERVAAATRDTVAGEVARQLAEFRESLAGVASAAPNASGDTSWMAALAMEISKVGDQNAGRAVVAPEEIAKRNKAKARLVDLLEATIAAGVQPDYTLRQMVYLGDRKIQPFWVDRNRVAHPTEIGWWGEPNQYMEPVNAPARAIMELYLESIGDTRKTANLRVTAGGLVVRSGGMNPEGGRDQAPQVGRDAPTIKGRGAETKTVEQRILGTLMPPAKQMV